MLRRKGYVAYIGLKDEYFYFSVPNADLHLRYKISFNILRILKVKSFKYGVLTLDVKTNQGVVEDYFHILDSFNKLHISCKSKLKRIRNIVITDNMQKLQNPSVVIGDYEYKLIRPAGWEYIRVTNINDKRFAALFDYRSLNLVSSTMPSDTIDDFFNKLEDLRYFENYWYCKVENTRLSWKRICELYPEQWVYLKDIECNDDDMVKSACVVFGQSDREYAHDKYRYHQSRLAIKSVRTVPVEDADTKRVVEDGVVVFRPYYCTSIEKFAHDNACIDMIVQKFDYQVVRVFACSASAFVDDKELLKEYYICHYKDDENIIYMANWRFPEVCKI